MLIEGETAACIQRLELNQSSPLYQVKEMMTIVKDDADSDGIVEGGEGNGVGEDKFCSQASTNMTPLH